ncbi:MAG: glycoside hydrolase family 88 protein [Bacteroidetes bacterium]|nr:glycoside hydrolase family 88 protein [Bacteroidota bacterium]
MQTKLFLPLLFISTGFLHFSAGAQVTPARPNDVTAPLHAMKPDYPGGYGAPAAGEIKAVLDRIYQYLDRVTPAQLVDKKTGTAVADIKKADTATVFAPGDFRLLSYEWGVVYSGMLQAAEATGDAHFSQYVYKRQALIADAFPVLKAQLDKYPVSSNALRTVIHPRALDDCGAVCASMIKSLRSGGPAGLRPVIDNFIDFISNKEFRLPDGTLARNRPHRNSLWLDDLYMGIPALAQMGKLTGDKKYYDDAVKQLLQFSARMFVKEKGLYMHGWVQDMDPHPVFHWARANGWALMATVELLDVLPENHPQRPAILDLLRAHIKGLAACQSGVGSWHQLLDRSDSYLETSATAIYAYCIARAVNKGWIDGKAYAPMATLAWHAVAAKVNAQGQVEGTCVGTGMGFDPAFYYYRPVNVFAAHGYGPVLLAGAEMIQLLKRPGLKINDSALQYYDQESPANQ